MRNLEWSTIKTAVNSRFARLTALVPIIGWVLIADDELAKVLAKILNQPSLKEPSWKIYAFHAGLSIYGLGVALFYIICPETIKSSSSFNEFARSEGQTLTSDRLEVQVSELQKADIESPNRNDHPLAGVGGPPLNSSSGRDYWYQKNQDYILKVQESYYKYQNTRKSLGKLFVMALLIPGAILATIPSIDTICWSLGRFGKLVFSQNLNQSSSSNQIKDGLGDR